MIKFVLIKIKYLTPRKKTLAKLVKAKENEFQTSLINGIYNVNKNFIESIFSEISEEETTNFSSTYKAF